MGQASWVLSGNVFYPIDLSPMHRLFQFFDSYGQMTIKLEIVPKFLAVDLPVLMKKISVRLGRFNGTDTDSDYRATTGGDQAQ